MLLPISHLSLDPVGLTPPGDRPVSTLDHEFQEAYLLPSRSQRQNRAGLRAGSPEVSSEGHVGGQGLGCRIKGLAGAIRDQRGFHEQGEGGGGRDWGMLQEGW